ncbi:MAG: NYN domain-containing protein [Planctomycetes bacterium]|nr:NYN domain-containing protein [Planctomycetota bacterium]
MPYLIDGYNLLWALDHATDDHHSINDAQLCNAISKFLALINDTGEIIFDGIGPPDKTPFENLHKLEVIFSGTRTDADTVIEDKIETCTAPKRLTVVSSDNRIRKAARARKAVSLKSDVFWNKLSVQIKRPRPASSEPPQKRKGLSHSETDHWMDIFGIDQ